MRSIIPEPERSTSITRSLSAGRPRGPELVDEAALDRPAAELMPIGELQLAQHRRHVRLDGLGGDRQPLCDLLVHVAAGYVAQDLALARGQLVELRVDLALR